MMYIDEFNEMTGTRYTKESFIKLFNQYFPNGDGKNKENYYENYKKMYEHALRFSIRSYVFKEEGNTDVTKVADGLNELFSEQINDYNKLIEKRGNPSQKIHFIKDGGLDLEMRKQKMIECIDDIPQTTLDEEKLNIEKLVKFGQKLSDDEVFKNAAISRINAIMDEKSGYSRDDKIVHSSEIIKIMTDRLISHDKNYKLSHPLKLSEEKKSIDFAKSIIFDNGFDESSIEKLILSGSKKTELFSKIEDNINGISKTNEPNKNVDFRKQLESLTSDILESKQQTKEVNNISRNLDFNLKK